MKNYSETRGIMVKKMVVVLWWMFMVMMGWEGEEMDGWVVGGMG
ncbi:hypothetical protein [Paenibacillus sp. Y412MC10]|nr:hypothetical protein [Paenibacillus sp. Y412MC10]